MSAQLSLYNEEPFLQSVARAILAKHAHHLPEVHVVLPTRRACLYFKHYLAGLINRPFIAPKIASVDDFIHSITGMRPMNKVEQLLALYQEFVKLSPQSLDEFAPLGMVMLQDFALIERNLNQSSVNRFFAWLEEAKAIDRWAEELGETPKIDVYAKDYLGLWQHFKTCYKSLRKKFKSEKKGFPALVYRHFLEGFDLYREAGAFRFINWVGFNQLTQVEIQIIERTVKEGCGDTFWDFDRFYTHQPRHTTEASAHEAGYFFRLLKEKKIFHQSPNFVKDRIITQPRQINIMGIPNRVVQAQLAASILHELIQKEPDYAEKINFVALLLPDEALLIPLLRAIEPDLFEQVNITMGLPIKQSQAYRLVMIFFALRKSAIQESDGTLRYFATQVLELLSHPFFSLKSHGEAFFTITHKLREQIRSGQLLRLGNKDLEGLPGAFFAHWQSAAQCAASLRQALEWANAALNPSFFLESIEREFLFSIYQTVSQLEAYLGEESAQLFEELLIEMLRGEAIPFSGQPLAPIQIMGLLESRALDFEHIIVLSCNEGILPKAKRADSIIPFDLKRTFRLQTHREHDAAIAYTFYRLLHHCRTAHYIYDSSDRMGPSRFLYQIELELGRTANVTFVKKHLSLPQPTRDSLALSLPKTPEVLDKIRQKLACGISPTAIIRFLQSPLDFYLADVLGLEEAAMPDEDMDERTFGILVHGILQRLLQPYLFRYTDGIDQTPLQTIQEAAQAVAEAQLSALPMSSGKNFLLKNAAELLVKSYLSGIKEKFMPLAIEMPLETPVKLPSDIPLVLKGQVDRLDWDGNSLRIVDYKTSRSYGSGLKAKNWEQLLTNPSKSKIIQPVLYRYLLYKTPKAPFLAHLPPHLGGDDMPVKAGFLFLKAKEKEFQTYCIEDESPEVGGFLEQTEQFLERVVAQMLNPDVPLMQKSPFVEEDTSEQPTS